MQQAALALMWRKSSYSNGHGGDCVQVAAGTHLVRDTKDQGNGPILRFSSAEWRAFVAGVKNNEFAV